MAIEDGYFLGRALRNVDLTDSAAVQAALQSYEDPRKPHTARQVQQAWTLGKVFHHTPRSMQPLRDCIFDHTPFLQRVAGVSNPKTIATQLALIEDLARTSRADGGCLSPDRAAVKAQSHIN